MRRGTGKRSAVAISAASMTADACAAESFRPLPWLTASVFEFGRTAIQTGMPIRSSPVTSARRVMPKRGNCWRMRATVSVAQMTRSR